MMGALAVSGETRGAAASNEVGGLHHSRIGTTSTISTGAYHAGGMVTQPPDHHQKH